MITNDEGRGLDHVAVTGSRLSSDEVRCDSDGEACQWMRLAGFCSGSGWKGRGGRGRATGGAGCGLLLRPE